MEHVEMSGYFLYAAAKSYGATRTQLILFGERQIADALIDLVAPGGIDIIYRF